MCWVTDYRPETGLGYSHTIMSWPVWLIRRLSLTSTLVGSIGKEGISSTFTHSSAEMVKDWLSSSNTRRPFHCLQVSSIWSGDPERSASIYASLGVFCRTAVRCSSDNFGKEFNNSAATTMTMIKTTTASVLFIIHLGVATIGKLYSVQMSFIYSTKFFLCQSSNLIDNKN